MPRYTDSQYQKMAKAIVADFVNEDVPLSNGFHKVAEDAGLNAHEAQRLLQTTNTTAHLDLFEKMSEDRYVKFEPLDPDKEMPALFGAEEKTAHVEVSFHDLALDLPDERWASQQEAVEKVAASLVPELEEEPLRGPYEGQRGWDAVRLLEKTAEELEMELRIAHLDYEDATHKLATMLRRADALPYAEFEKDAMAIHGPSAEPVVAKLRNALNVADAPFQKEARHYVITRREHEALASVMGTFETLQKYAQAFKWFQEQRQPLAL